MVEKLGFLIVIFVKNGTVHRNLASLKFGLIEFEDLVLSSLKFGLIELENWFIELGSEFRVGVYSYRVRKLVVELGLKLSS